MPAQTQSLERQIEDQRQELKDMDQLKQKLDDLEQEMKANEQKKEIAEQQAAEKAKSAPSVSAGANGFVSFFRLLAIGELRWLRRTEVLACWPQKIARSRACKFVACGSMSWAKGGRRAYMSTTAKWRTGHCSK